MPFPHSEGSLKLQASVTEAIMSVAQPESRDVKDVQDALNTDLNSDDDTSSADTRSDQQGVSSGSLTRSQTPESPASAFNTPSLKNEGFPEKQDDDAILERISLGLMQLHSLESEARDLAHAVNLRRQAFENLHGMKCIRDIPHENYEYESVLGRCIENPIGYVPIPLGIAGPLLVDGISCFVPMATTEGTLVASTSRGAKTLHLSGGVSTALLDEGMTRAPLIIFRCLAEAIAAKNFLESSFGFDIVREAFDATSRYASLSTILISLVGRKMFIRFKAKTGEAMGMNMVSKGVDAALEAVRTYDEFRFVKIETLSSNLCSDKKSAAVNWIAGRGRSMVGEAVVSGAVIRRILKTTPAALAQLNLNKNFIGGALAGAAGGAQNANAANIVAAIFAATGQDLAQVVESSSCMVVMERYA
jgi:hydroxymethylglutaryl-CoA reductase (NADPH)